jgi:hypothetical protein
MEEKLVITPCQRALALAALHAVHCPGCEPVLTIPADVQAVNAEGRVSDEYRWAVRWSVIRDRVRQLGDYAVNWFRLQLPRFEQDLLKADTQVRAEAARADVEAMILGTKPVR